MAFEGAPWASGPAEILQHGLSLLGRDTDTNRRLAMIAIDNSVELMIKTYLGLPSRVTKLKLKRGQCREIAESFPKLLDALEENAPKKLEGIDLGNLEWFHRLRNELYHQGNGLTVERDKVEVYAQLALLLFHDLFGFVLAVNRPQGFEMLGDFMNSWAKLERRLADLAATMLTSNQQEPPFTALYAVRRLIDSGMLPTDVATEINALRVIRNSVAHGTQDHSKVVTPDVLKRTKGLIRSVEKLLAEKRVSQDGPAGR